jgi:hypothetical protein
MNTHLHRKQIVILALAMALAAASYLIPLPRQTDAQPPRLLGLIDQATPAEAIAYAREPATIWRFPVTVQVPQTPIPIAARLAEAVESESSLSKSRLMSPQDFTSSDRIPVHYPPQAPVKGFDPSPGR